MAIKFSASQLKKWQECALQGKFQYIDRLGTYKVGSSAYLGTAVHYALEQLHLGVAEPSEIEGIFLQEYDSGEPDYIVRRTTYSGLRDKGKKMIKAYLETWGLRDIEILGVEKRFMVPMGKHMVSGVVDLLYIYNDELYIVDLKTGAKPNYDNLYLNIQFTTYDFAVTCPEFWVGIESDDPKWPDKYEGWEDGVELYERIKDMPRNLIWYDLRDNREIDVGKRGPKDYGRLYRLMEMIDRSVETETFMPNISGDSCTYCDFHKECPVWFDNPEISVVDFD